jgi:hypothetical protein
MAFEGDDRLATSAKEVTFLGVGLGLVAVAFV